MTADTIDSPFPRTLTILVHAGTDLVDVQWTGLTDDEALALLEMAQYAVGNPSIPGVSEINDLED